MDGEGEVRLIDWTEFQTMPEGTIFQEWSLHDLKTLQVLSVASDMGIVASDLLPCCMTSDYWSNQPPGTDAEFIVASPIGFGRDGLFEYEKRKWLIWDEIDRKRLAEWLLSPAKAVADANEDIAIYGVPERFT